MSKEVKKATGNFIYKKDSTLSAAFDSYESAKEYQETLIKKYSEPMFRVRTRYRQRTGTWDVIVKVRTEVKSAAQQSPSRAEGQPADLRGA